MEASKKLNYLLLYLKISANRLSKEIGMEQNTTIYNLKKNKHDFSEDIARKITLRYPEISYIWLLTGEGEMLKTSQSNKSPATSTEHYNAPLLPVSAMGGSLNEFSKGVMQYDVEQIVSPIKGVDFVISVSGDSMYPDYPNGCKVFIKKVNENLFLQWGEVYVLDTQNGIIIKRIKKSEKEGCIICESNDQNYTPFELEIAQVHGFYKILLMMIAK